MDVSFIWHPTEFLQITTFSTTTFALGQDDPADVRLRKSRVQQMEGVIFTSLHSQNVLAEKTATRVRLLGLFHQIATIV